MSEQINEIREVKHDIRHFVGAIKRLAEDERYNELNSFLNELAEITETDPLPIFCDNAVANSILGYYFLMAKKSGIQFYCACSIQKRLSINDSDLCIVMGNAIENAIEACEKLDNKQDRFVSVEARTINNQLLIKIENSYDGCLTLQNGGFVSTKREKSHGLGMKNIKRIVEANGGFIKTAYDGSLFTLMAAFPIH